jgi:tRNA (guanosine-2'-O-)-methyltransferase
VRRNSDDVAEAASLAAPRTPWGPSWNARCVIGALESFVSEERRARLRRVIEARVGSVTVLMDAPHDPHNLAAVLRTCDAFGLPELHVVPRAEAPLIGKSVAKGTQRWVDLLVHGSVSAAVGALRARGFVLVATRPEGKLTPEALRDIPRVALLAGNEHDGLREELEQAASETVRVPMRGFVESLNVSVATAVLVQAATSGRPGDLPSAERELLYARGLFHSVPQAERILAASPR